MNEDELARLRGRRCQVEWDRKTIIAFFSGIFSLYYHMLTTGP